MPADPTTSAAPLTTAERNAQEAVREQGLCGAIGNGRVCIRDPHRGPHGFETMPEPDTAATKETARMSDDARMSGGRFARPKSLYIEATGIKDDGSEFVVKMRLEAATSSDSFLTLDMENLTIEDASNGLYVVQAPTGEHNVKIEFTRCCLGDPDA